MYNALWIMSAYCASSQLVMVADVTVSENGGTPSFSRSSNINRFIANDLTIC